MLSWAQQWGTGGAAYAFDRSWLYAYDALERLISAEFGVVDLESPLTGGAEVLPGGAAVPEDPTQLAPVPRVSTWGLDTLGNWDGVYDPDGTGSGPAGRTDTGDLDGDGSGGEELRRVLDADLANRVTDVTTWLDGDPQPTVPLVYDGLGSLVADEKYHYQYDAWGRLCRVSHRGTLAFNPDGTIASGEAGEWIAEFVYDGLGRHVATWRIWDAGWGDGSGDLRTREFFHDGVRALAEVVQDPIQTDEQGRAIRYVYAELDQGAGVQTWTEREWVHSPFYVDELVCEVTPGDRPRFVVQDANYNVTGVADEYGDVLGQWAYDPYGSPLKSDVFEASFPTRLGHQGLPAERLTGLADEPSLIPGADLLYHNRNRTYSPKLGRFLQRDPNSSGGDVLSATSFHGVAVVPVLDQFDAERRYADGMNLYAALGSNPANRTDPSGLFIGFGIGATTTTDLYLDYNEEAINAGVGIGDALSQLLNDYGWNQLDAAEAALDWETPDTVFSPYAGVAGLAVVTENHHIIPRFLLGLDRAANRLELPEDLHDDYHRMLEDEFRRAGLYPVSSRGEKRWRYRLGLPANDPLAVGDDELRSVRAALLRSGRRFDRETDGKYNLARKISANLNDVDISKGLRIRRRGRR